MSTQTHRLSVHGHDAAPGEALRIAMVTETYPPEINGVASTLPHFVRGLLERGHFVQLIRPRQARDQLALSSGRFDEVLTGAWPIPGYPSLRMGRFASARLHRQWLWHRPQIVHIATQGPLGYSALIAAQRLGLPVSADFRTNFHAYARHYGASIFATSVLAYLRHFHNRIDATAVPTAALRDDLAGKGFARLHVIGRGVETRSFSPVHRSAELRLQWGLGATGMALLNVGRLAPEKNITATLAAYDAIRQQRADTRLIMVGDGPMLADLRRTRPDVIWAGAQRGMELARTYASADLFLFPSLSETFGNVTLEALASGLPVVAHRHAAAAQLLSQGVGGLLADGFDLGDFVRAALHVAQMDAAQRTQLGVAGCALAQANAWPAVVTHFERFLRDTMARARPLSERSTPRSVGFHPPAASHRGARQRAS